MKTAGFDIGTTTVCGILLDDETGAVIRTETQANDAWLSGADFERIQDPEAIWQCVRQLYQEFLRLDPAISAIGLTGQMHGIVYVDADGQAVSPLYTWQDERGNQNMAASCTYAEHLSAQTGYAMATGYGLTTHFYNLQNGLVPESAVSFCTIQDYVGMRLTGRKRPLVASSNAASLGCFDLERLCFDLEAAGRAGVDPAMLPEVETGFAVLGTTAEGIPVSVAIGDNQASVIGSVRETEGSLLINIGTSSQVSVGVKGYRAPSGVELRPVVNEDYILVGAGLCGGRAYAMLEQFFARTVEAMTGKAPEGKLYGCMASLLAERGLEPGTLTVDTRFCGTRQEPERTGAISHLRPDNFTPEEFTFGILRGMTEELLDFYRRMQACGAGAPVQLIGSGNAVRSNPYLRQIFEAELGMRMQVPAHREEAAFGSALFALASAGRVKTLKEAQQLIAYEA